MTSTFFARATTAPFFAAGLAATFISATFLAVFFAPTTFFVAATGFFSTTAFFVAATFLTTGRETGLTAGGGMTRVDFLVPTAAGFLRTAAFLAAG